MHKRTPPATNHISPASPSFVKKTKNASKNPQERVLRIALSIENSSSVNIVYQPLV
jgi:hypothetical protein